MSMDYSGIPGEYYYTQTQRGKTAYGIITNGATSDRDYAAQRCAGGEDRQPGDQGGHLIANRFGGRNDPTNLDAQAANVNQKEQANVERNVASLASDSNNTVYMSVSNYNSVGNRPEATMINLGLQDDTTGKLDEQHISFQNANHNLQQSWNDTVDQAEQTIDSVQDIGMTDEQRNIANELSGAEIDIDDRLGSGWEYKDFDSSFLEEETTKSEMLGSLTENEVSMDKTSEEIMESDVDSRMEAGESNQNGLGE